MGPFSLKAARQNVTTDCFYLQNVHDRICVQLASSKSLATNASFTDYPGNGKQILKIMEDKENKREKNDATLDHRLTNVRIFIARGCPTTKIFSPVRVIRGKP